MKRLERSRPPRASQALPALAKVISVEALTQSVLPKLLQKAEDGVPNVKFNVCKALEALPRSPPPEIHCAGLQ